MHETTNMVMPIYTQHPPFHMVTKVALFIYHRLLRQPALGMLQQTGLACTLHDTGVTQEWCYHL